MQYQDFPKTLLTHATLTAGILLATPISFNCERNPPQIGHRVAASDYSIHAGQPKDIMRLLAANGILLVDFADDDVSDVQYRLLPDGTLQIVHGSTLCPWLGEGTWRIENDNLVLQTMESRSVDCTGPRSASDKKIQRRQHLILSDIQCIFLDSYCLGAARTNKGSVQLRGDAPFGTPRKTSH